MSGDGNAPATTNQNEENLTPEQLRRKQEKEAKNQAKLAKLQAKQAKLVSSAIIVSTLLKRN